MRNIYYGISSLAMIVVVVSLFGLINAWKGYNSHDNAEFFDISYAENHLNAVSELIADDDESKNVEALLDSINSDLKIYKEVNSQLWDSTEKRLFTVLVFNFAGFVFSVILFLSLAVLSERFKRNDI